MRAADILAQLRPLGAESYRRVLRNHGVPEPMFGVKIEELKKFQRRIKRDYQLALDLYATGNYDARYLAGLIADDARMTKEDLRGWLAQANCGALCEYTIPWVAAGSPHGHELALEWIDAGDESSGTAGWATLGSLVATKPDDELDLPELEELLARVRKTVHRSPNLTRYMMNQFVIAVGCHVPALTERALETAAAIGPVTVDMGKTSCKVPGAAESIRKAQRRGAIGRKRKSAKC